MSIGSNRSLTARSAAVPGINCVRPPAPTGDTEHPLLADTRFFRVTVTLTRPDAEAKTLEFLTFVNEETKSVRVGAP